MSALLKTALDYVASHCPQREYEYLREALENDSKERFFVVTGQPGTGSLSYCPLSSGNHISRFCILHAGKTLFVLYLHLYRPEKELPMAVHFRRLGTSSSTPKGGQSTISDDSETLLQTVEVAAIAWALDFYLFAAHLQPPSSQKNAWFSAV